MSNRIKLSTKGLDDAIRAFKANGIGKLPKVKVGVLASGDHRPDGESNASIGAIHEFGNSTHPVRSWLRIPLTENFDSYLNKSGAINKDSIMEVIAEKSIVTWMKKIGHVAVNVILDGFATGGFGKWAPWKGSYQSRTGDILVDTKALRDSVTFEVKE